jgi:hypothetical protein
MDENECQIPSLDVAAQAKPVDAENASFAGPEHDRGAAAEQGRAVG